MMLVKVAVVFFVPVFVCVSSASLSFEHCETSFDTLSQTTSLICRDLHNEMELYEDLKLAQDIQELVIMNSALRFFVDGTFLNTKLKEIVIYDSHLMGFTNTDVAFDGLQNHLEAFYLQNCTFADGLNWNQLRELRALVFISVGNSDLEYIPDLSALSNNQNLSMISMSRNHLTEIHPNAFRQLNNLKWGKLSNNQIRSIQRSMFSDPANLVLLDVRNNFLASLPKDMFSNMPRLRSVLLQNNMMFTICEDAFGLIINQLFVLRMDGNPISCDCRLRWITGLHLKSSKLQASCSTPSRHKGKSVTELEGSDLWC